MNALFWIAVFSLLIIVGICIKNGFGKRIKYSNQKKKLKSFKITFLHPDLGIGGAENLIINAAIALKNKGHYVRIFTAHHDVTHCFEETRGNGILAKSIQVHGDWLPRTIFGRMYAFCAMIRMIYLALVVLMEKEKTDVYICDQVSTPIPILRLKGTPVLFYCHFPDKLLCTERKSFFKRLYRLPVDLVEELTTGAADEILVNSQFTSTIFSKSFTLLRNIKPKILFPPIHVNDFLKTPKNSISIEDSDKIYLVSINRFERKKNIMLAACALNLLRTMVSPSIFSRIRLILAGGYDHQNIENVEHLQELKDKVEQLDLKENVEFLTSISSEKKLELYYKARFVIYTPNNEHFGIVPVEAMCAGTPVIAVASGGPLETIVDQVTGFHCKNDAESFANAFKQLVNEDGVQYAKMLGENGRKRAQNLFSFESFETALNDHVLRLFQ